MKLLSKNSHRTVCKDKKNLPDWGGKTNNMIYNKKQNSFRRGWGAKAKNFHGRLIKRPWLPAA